MFEVRELDRGIPILHWGAEFLAPSWCPGCGSKLEVDQKYWFASDGDMLMTECMSCHTHFGVTGTY